MFYSKNVLFLSETRGDEELNAYIHVSPILQSHLSCAAQVVILISTRQVRLKNWTTMDTSLKFLVSPRVSERYLYKFFGRMV